MLFLTFSDNDLKVLKIVIKASNLLKFGANSLLKLKLYGIRDACYRHEERICSKKH